KVANRPSSLNPLRFYPLKRPLQCLVRGLTIWSNSIHAELERQRLISACTLPDWHRKADRLELEKERRQWVPRQLSGRLFRVEVRLAGQRMHLDPLLDGIQQIIRHLPQVRDLLAR